MIKNYTQTIRTKYANSNRQRRLFNNTKRVAWKTPSRFVA